MCRAAACLIVTCMWSNLIIIWTLEGTSPSLLEDFGVWHTWALATSLCKWVWSRTNSRAHTHAYAPPASTFMYLEQWSAGVHFKCHYSILVVHWHAMSEAVKGILTRGRTLSLTSTRIRGHQAAAPLPPVGKKNAPSFTPSPFPKIPSLPHRDIHNHSLKIEYRNTDCSSTLMTIHNVILIFVRQDIGWEDGVLDLLTSHTVSQSHLSLLTSLNHNHIHLTHFTFVPSPWCCSPDQHC